MTPVASDALQTPQGMVILVKINFYNSQIFPQNKHFVTLYTFRTRYEMNVFIITFCPFDCVHRNSVLKFWNAIEARPVKLPNQDYLTCQRIVRVKIISAVLLHMC
jgi:hypothetical protein